MQTIRHLLVEGDGERSDVDLHGACIRHANQQISAHELLGGSIPIGDVAELGHNLSLIHISSGCDGRRDR